MKEQELKNVIHISKKKDSFTVHNPFTETFITYNLEPRHLLVRHHNIYITSIYGKKYIDIIKLYNLSYILYKHFNLSEDKVKDILNMIYK